MDHQSHIGDHMTFWIIAVGLAIAVAALLALALRAPMRASTEPAAAYDLKVYRDQLRDVDKDITRGVVSQTDAERLRTEISRRILTADAALRTEPADSGASKGKSWVFGMVLAVAVVGGSLSLYRTLGAPGYGDLALKDRIALAEDARANRPNQQEAEDSMPAFVTPADVSPDYVVLVEQLRSAVENRPDDMQGHILLAQNEANLGNFPAAARAQGQVVALLGNKVATEDITNYADMLIVAAGGYVSPEAEAVLNDVLRRDPSNGTARYYMGLMLAQTGRPDSGFRIWDQLLRQGPAEAPWIEPILAQIEKLSLRAGVNYQIPEIGTGNSAPRGPSSEDIEAAADMSPSDRMAMIESMVAGLSDRLATEGGPAEDWAQLITALGVLGKTGDARLVYDNAVEVFAEDTRALDLLLRAGQQAQVTE